MAGRLVRWAIAIVLVCAHASSHAIDAVSFDLLSGNESRIGRLGLQWKWGHKWPQGENTELTGYWDLSFSRWENRRHQRIPNNTQYLNDIGIGATLRLQAPDRTGPYLEAATGPHWLSEHYDNNGRDQASRVVFQSHAGVGFAWKNGMELGFKAMHMSNGGLRTPNGAVNVYGVDFRWWW